MQATGISQLPVLQDGKPVGSVQEVTLARLLHDDRDPSKVTVGEIMARPLPQLETYASTSTRRTGCCWRATPACSRRRRHRRRHRHADRPDPVLGPHAQDKK